MLRLPLFSSPVFCLLRSVKPSVGSNLAFLPLHSIFCLKYEFRRCLNPFSRPKPRPSVCRRASPPSPSSDQQARTQNRRRRRSLEATTLCAGGPSSSSSSLVLSLEDGQTRLLTLLSALRWEATTRRRRRKKKILSFCVKKEIEAETAELTDGRTGGRTTLPITTSLHSPPSLSLFHRPRRVNGVSLPNWTRTEKGRKEGRGASSEGRGSPSAALSHHLSSLSSTLALLDKGL